MTFNLHLKSPTSNYNLQPPVMQAAAKEKTLHVILSVAVEFKNNEQNIFN
jgi:hypothetical protein